MSELLFDNNYVYPSDRYGGQYIVLSGEILSVSEICDHLSISVKTDKGTFTGYTPILSCNPKVGYIAQIKIYDCGGGWYPDNQIMGWSSSEKKIEKED
jgi:hypothetical protein